MQCRYMELVHCGPLAKLQTKAKFRFLSDMAIATLWMPLLAKRKNDCDGSTTTVPIENCLLTRSKMETCFLVDHTDFDAKFASPTPA
jgi:hypothetical protein